MPAEWRKDITATLPKKGNVIECYNWNYLPDACKYDTRWFKYDRDYLCVNKSQFVPVIFEPPCIFQNNSKSNKGCHGKTFEERTTWLT
jgi:hypothetical protein